MATKSEAIELEVGERTVRISNPDRVYFSARGETKLDLAKYYMSVGDGIVRALRERPCMLHRFPSGVDGEKVHQKRVPKGAPPWLKTVRITFPRFDRTADELCVTELAQRHLGGADVDGGVPSVELPVRGRRDAPTSGGSTSTRCPTVRFDRVRRVARTAHEVLDEIGAVGWPKTSGGHGIHIYVRDRARPRLRRRPPRRAGLRPRGGAARARRRHHHLVAQGPRPRRSCSWTTTRTPATTRSRRRTRCAASPRAPCRRRSPGTRSTTSQPAGPHHRHHARPLRRAGRPARRDRRRGL